MNILILTGKFGMGHPVGCSIPEAAAAEQPTGCVGGGGGFSCLCPAKALRCHV